jgi:hypothetical protein
MGNRNLVSVEREVTSFNRINSGGSAEVRFHSSPVHRVVVTSDSNLIPFITTEVRNNTLHIGTVTGSYNFTKLQVDVYSPSLTFVSISGSGRFSAFDTIVTSNFESTISGSGRLSGIIETSNFSANIAGSGRVTVVGNSNDSSIKISGSGSFNGTEFFVNNANVQIGGSGNANIHVSNSLDATVTGSGRLNYRGNPPTVRSQISGTGRINSF